MKQLNLILLFLFSLLFTQIAQAQEHFIDGLNGNAISTKSGSPLAFDGEIKIEDQYYNCSVSSSASCPHPYTILGSKLYAKLWFDDALRNYYGSDWKVEITYSIDLVEQNATATATTNLLRLNNQKLSIDFHPTMNYKDIDIFVHAASPGFYMVKAKLMVTNVSITKQDDTAITTNPFGTSLNLADDIHLDVNLEMNRAYRFYQSSRPEIFFNSYQYTFFDASTNQLTIPWSYVHGANTYDFEWLFVDIGNNLETDAFEIDFKNATRISTKQNFYKISMAYPRGYLIFRVRGVGLEESVLNSGNFDRRLEGQWSFGSNDTYAKQGPEIIAVNGPSYRKTNDFYFWDGLESDKNWQYNVVYAEEGKRKEVIQFFDDILKPDQTATILNTDESAVIAQNVTDFVGRNSLQVLPAPQPSQGVRYYDPMHKNPSGTHYSYTDFDLDINSSGQGIMDPKRLSSFNNLGAGYYYSTTNTNPQGINGSYIPDAKGFPFSRTTYKNDGSGRVKEITGVGEEYHTGVERHKTLFFYSSPIQEVLFMLFGNEVGYAKYYEKTIVIDANGQASAAYKDLSGRVIATSLVGDAPDNLLDIDTKPATYDTITSNLSHLNGQQGEAMIINKTITVIGVSEYTFEYTIPAAVFDSCGVTNDCKYDLEIYILDEYGVKVDLEYSRSIMSEISRTNIDRVRANNPIQFSANLTTGSYQLIKELTLNQIAIDSVMADFMANQICFLPEPWDSITTCNPGCDEICDNAYLSLPDRNGVQYYLSVDDGHRVAKVVNGAIQSPFIDPTGYRIVKDSIQACKDRCNNPPPISECDIKYELLKLDMSPGGQYFDNLPDYYLADGIRLNPSYNRNGWLTSSSTRGNPHFAEIERCLNSKNNHGETTSQFWIDLRTNWKPAYADILIKLHPEWCAFETLCCASSACTGGSNSISPTIDSISITLSFQDSCMQLTPAERDTIKRQIAKIKRDSVNFNYLSAQALAELNNSGITDPDILAQFSPRALEDRVRDFYYEYFRYQRVKNRPCNHPNLYLDSPDENGITADGFQIRYPQNVLFENFDPADPNSITNYISSQGCEQAATQMADDFINKLKAKCDNLSSIQEKEYWKHVYDEYLRDCQDPAITIDLNQSIVDYNACHAQLEEACYINALPNQNDTLCACGKINDFVYDIYSSKDNTIPPLSFEDVMALPSIATHDYIQDALDAVTTGNDSLLVSSFEKWFGNCNDPQYLSWMGPNPAPPYQLASYFECAESTGVRTECDTCCVNTINAYAKSISEMNFANLLRLKARDYRQAYIDHCLKNALDNEALTMTYTFNEYHWTLYYYDQAGSLVKTIPPEGVFQKDPQGVTVYHNSLLRNPEILKAWDYLIGEPSSTYQHPAHLMITNYQYNSLQNVVIQNTPDGGTTQFWYDGLGRLAVSQNAVQIAKRAYSYLQYDVLGRTTEAGELISTTAMDKTIAEDVNDFNNPLWNGGTNLLLNWLAGKPKTESTYSFYDLLAVSPGHPIHSLQDNLRNRISTVAYDKDGDLQYDALTHYSYDVLGNVETLWQENKDIQLANHQVKRLDYSYDLVSGNVNQVSYQKGEDDQFMHRYSYDADNRLTKVQTSTNDLIWETDARYFYYAHGPLAREEIGDKIAFANDYVFDIRGWMTAMNSSMVNATLDAGKDGVKGGLNENIGRDPFAFSLKYFDGHYSPILASNQGVIATSFSGIDSASPIQSADTKALYNGNISMMVTSLKDLAQKPIAAMANTYRYDQLNRIKSYKPFWEDNASNTTKPLATNNFDNVTNVGSFYNANYWFDGNGNIDRLKRNGITSASLPDEKMDDMAYGYNNVSTTSPSSYPFTTADAKINNQLFGVDDAHTTAGYDADIESGQAPDNYQYDAIGRLIKDKQEKIDLISWNVSNKVTSFMQSDKNADVLFTYDPMGNRIGKLVKAKIQTTPYAYDPSKETETYYMLDAQGNPMAIYKYDISTGILTLEDFILYGNKRLGTNTQDKTMR